MSPPAVWRPQLLGKLNERHVFRVLQAHGPMSRAEVARRSGVSPPTASKAVASLLGAGLIEEVAPPGAARGRPAPLLRLAVERAQVLGVEIDAEGCRVTAAGLDGVPRPGAVRELPTPATYPALIDALTAACGELARPGVTTLSVGVSLPGLIDDRLGRGVLSPNLPMTDGRTPARDLGERLGLDAVLVHEVQALLLAERLGGEAAQLADFAVLDVGVGVGLGVFAGGRPMTGRTGHAGEIGHMTVVPDGGRSCGCGNTGCLETVAADGALARRVGRKLGRAVTVAEALEVVGHRPDDFRGELDATARAIALGVAAVVNLFNPATVFLHSRVLARDPGFLPAVRAAAAERALPPNWADCRLAAATGTKARGAVAAAVRHLTDAVAAGLPPV
jgi:predicted NBD/HSP70 family sugar kinase